MTSSDIYVKKNDSGGTKLWYLWSRIICDCSSIPNIRNIYEKLIKNHDIYRSQAFNKLLYHKRVK